MAYLDEIATILSGSTVAALPGGSTASGWYMYKGMLPDSTAVGSKGIALLETAGAGVVERVGYDNLGLQVVVRGDPMNSTEASVYATAQAKMTQARDVLSGYTGTTTTNYLGIWCQNHAFLGYDDNWRPQFVANFRVMRAST